jgi:hypothetical protein
MHGGIIDQQLQRSPRLLAQWKQVSARQGPGLEDLIEQGTIDAVISGEELPREIDVFLAKSELAGIRVVGTIRREMVRGRTPTRDYPVVALQGSAG